MENEKRVFFGMEVAAPWPEKLPHGRLLDPPHRHLTLAFLGNTDFATLTQALPTFPRPAFKVGFAAQFDQCLFLPPRHPRVVAWHLDWLEPATELLSFYATLVAWLQEKGFSPRVREELTPHVTLCRSPFHSADWKKHFSPLPASIGAIHLYESVGNLQYTSLWSSPLTPIFSPIDHAADLAFLIAGHNYIQLFYHAAAALAFHFPPLLPSVAKGLFFEQLDDVIIALNQLIAHVDQEIGSPFKAVSFHSRLEEKETVLQWEMIIDV